ncbi:hypothetical protein [Kitasatospora sp. NPDC085879]|uniref:hypothetical protein n=1 Tax=Kitasatospora sp. NPDC085879 TaxID=3154769 RepID=UPI0034365E1A
MTATNDAPDTTAADRWQHIEDRLAAIERRIREQSSTAIATIDACLTRLDALRHDLAHGPWPLRVFPTPANPPGIAPQPERAPTESQPATGHRHSPTGPDTPQRGAAVGHQAVVRVPA